KADVVHAASGILGEERRDRRGLAQRLEQFHLGIAGIDEDHGHAMLGQGLGLPHPGAQQVAILAGCGGKVRHGDGDVVETADHRLESLPSISLSTEWAALSTLVPGPKMAATPASSRKS